MFLAVSMHAANTLLHALGVPRQVVVDHALQVIDVDAPRGNAGGHEILDGAGLEVGQQLLSFSLNSVVDLVALLVYLVLVPLLVFFMLKDRQQLTDLLSRLLPSERGVLTRVGSEMNTQLGNYVRGKAIEIALVGAASYAAFLVLGLNYAALLALAVGLSVLIPYVGALVVTAPVLFVGYVQWGSGSEFLWLFGVYAVIQFLDGNVLVPLLFSEVNNLHPVAILTAVLIFGGVWGVFGVFFAIPLATLVQAVLNAWPRERPLSNPVPSA